MVLIEVVVEIVVEGVAVAVGVLLLRVLDAEVVTVSLSEMVPLMLREADVVVVVVCDTDELVVLLTLIVEERLDDALCEDVAEVLNETETEVV